MSSKKRSKPDTSAESSSSDLKSSSATKKKSSDKLVIPVGPISPMAIPMATPQLQDLVYKLVRKAAKAQIVLRGLRDVKKAFRNNPKGLVVLAGDTSPFDIISHFPVLCEEANVPYIFVEAKMALGYHTFLKRPLAVLFIQDSPKWKYNPKMTEVVDLINSQYSKPRPVSLKQLGL